MVDPISRHIPQPHIPHDPISHTKRPRDWPWSSYGAHAGHAEPASWLDSRALHKRLAPHAPPRDGAARYAEFVAQGKGVKLWDEALRGQIYLGGDAFMKRMQKQITGKPGSEAARPASSGGTAIGLLLCQGGSGRGHRPGVP